MLSGGYHKSIISLSVASILAGYIPLSAEPISYKQALERALAAADLTSLEVAASEAGQARVEQAKSLPNPSLFVQHEYLGRSSGIDESDETITGFSTSLDFIWKRGARVEAAERQGEIAQLQVADQKRHIAHKVARLYVSHAAVSQELEELSRAVSALERALTMAEALVENGDAPASSKRRIELAMQQHRMERVELQARQKQILSELSVLTAMPDATPQGFVSAGNLPMGNLQDAIATAMEARPDLQLAAAMHRWLDSEADLARAEGRPEASLDLGYKTDDTGRDGGYIGIEVELPIFKESRAPVHLARAESRCAEINYKQARRIIEAEVSTAYQRLDSLEALAASTSDYANAENEPYLTSSTAAFAAGEISLVEYLDTVRAYLEASRSQVYFKEQRQRALVELAHATSSVLSLYN